MIMPRLTRASTFAIALPALAVTALVAHGGAAHAAAPSTTVIATATARDLRIDVTAQRSGTGAAPTATARVVAFVKTPDGWQPRGELRLGARDGWFWNVLTGPHAIGGLTVSNAAPDRGNVQLLVSPALGWSPTYHFQLDHGKLVR
jgi:hypothetical protein